MPGMSGIGYSGNMYAMWQQNDRLTRMSAKASAEAAEQEKAEGAEAMRQPPPKPEPVQASSQETALPTVEDLNSASENLAKMMIRNGDETDWEDDGFASEELGNMPPPPPSPAPEDEDGNPLPPPELSGNGGSVMRPEQGEGSENIQSQMMEGPGRMMGAPPPPQEPVENKEEDPTQNVINISNIVGSV